jgi:hypothetical protein
MYPGPTGSAENHKKGYCSDDVKQTMKTDTVPEWPQPQGIFELGVTFNPMQFLITIRNVYENLVIENGSGDDLAMEYDAFVKLLKSRTIVLPDGRCLFKLYDLRMPLSTPSEILVNHNGSEYLRLDCFHDNDITAPPANENAA